MNTFWKPFSSSHENRFNISSLSVLPCAWTRENTSALSQCAGFVEGPCFLKFEASCIWTQTVSVPFTWFVVAVNRRCRRLRFSHFIRSLESHRNAHHFTRWDLWMIIKRSLLSCHQFKYKTNPRWRLCDKISYLIEVEKYFAIWRLHTLQL